MTLEQVYAAIGGDYKGVMERLLYGDNVFEKCGINRDGAGEVGKPRYFNGKRHF